MDRDKQEISAALQKLSALRNDLMFGNADPADDWSGVDLPDGIAADLFLRALAGMTAVEADLRLCRRVLGGEQK